MKLPSINRGKYGRFQKNDDMNDVKGFERSTSFADMREFDVREILILLDFQMIYIILFKDVYAAQPLSQRDSYFFS